MPSALDSSVAVSSDSVPRSSTSACITSVISRELPMVPITAPLASRSGILVAENHRSRPRGSINRSIFASMGSPLAITCRSSASACSACVGK